MVLFSMLLKNLPFHFAGKGDWWYNAIKHDRYDLFWAAHQHPPAPLISAAAQDVLNSIFRIDPAQRISIDELLASDWLKMGSDGATPIPSHDQVREFMADRKVTIDEQNGRRRKSSRSERRLEGHEEEEGEQASESSPPQASSP